MASPEWVSQSKLWNLNITQGSQEVQILILCQVRNDRPGRKKCTLIFISGCSVPSHSVPGHSSGRPHSVTDKSRWTVGTWKALGRCRLKLGVWADLYVVRRPTLLEVSELQSTLCQIPFCIQLSVCAKKLNKLGCKELHAAAALLQWVPELFHLHIASLACGSGTTTLHWKLWCRFTYERIIAVF